MRARVSRQSIGWTVLFVALVAAAYAVVRVRRDLVDFEVYRTAAIRAVAGESLYRPEDGHYQYKYLPAFALAMAPLGWIPDSIDEPLWFGLSAWLLVMFFRQSLRLLPSPRRTTAFLLTWAIVLTGKLWVKELTFGQTNVWIGLLALGALAAAEARRPRVAGSLVGVAIFVKPYAAILLPWLVVVSGLDGLVAWTVVVLAGLALPAARYGWHGNLQLLVDWYRTVTSTTEPNLLIPENVSLATMWAKWIGESATASWLALVTGAAALAAMAACLMIRRRVERPGYLEIGGFLLLVPLLSPQGWDYVFLLGLPAIVCLVDRVRDEALAWRVLTMASLATIAFSIFDLIGRAFYMRLMTWSVESVAGLGLALAIVHLRARALA